MRPRRAAVVVSLALALNHPGLGGWVLFAQQGEVTYDAKENKLRISQSYSPVAAPTAIQRIDQAAQNGRISQEDAARTKALIERYGTATPEVESALQNLTKDLENENKDAKITLAELYDRMTPAARSDDGMATFVQVLNQTSASQNVAVKSQKTGATLFYQNSVDLAPLKSRRVISRPDPNGSGRKIVEAVIEVEEKGSAEEQRVLYNRKVHLLFKNLKKLYYDQCALVRKINNGANPPVFKNENCKMPDGTYQIGFKDPDLEQKHLDSFREVYNKKQMQFDQLTFKMKDGRTMHLRGYLAILDAAVANGTLEKLAWEDLEAAQRLAMKFYGSNQLEMMQKYVIIQLSSYFGQVTNSQPKQKKGDKEMLDPSQKDLGELQETLDQIEKGRLEGYGLLMTKVFKLTELSHEDQKYITPDLMLAAGEAFAYVSYAVKAKERAFDPKLSGEEIDAAIEESSQWLKLAQIQLQTFEMHSLSIQMERLRDGQLRDHIGLRTDDIAGKAEATRLAKVAREQYLPRLKQAALETKQLLLKQSIGTFFLGIQNAARAQLYSDTLRERLRTLGAKAFEMKSLYLAAEFEKVKDNPEFKGRSAMDKLKGSAYEYFLQNRPAHVAELSDALDRFARSILELASKQNTDLAIRNAMRAKLEEFVALAKRLGFDQIPDVVKVKEEGERHSVKHAQFFAALQEHATKMRVFDMLNELDQYLSRYASPDMPDSDGATAWDKFVSFKWMDSAIDWVTGGTREKAIDAGLKRLPWTKEAFKKLGGEAKDLRRQILGMMASQKYEDRVDARGVKIKGAYSLIAELDPEGAKRALAEWEADQLEKDPFEKMDMVGFMSKTSEGKEAVAAQAAVGGLFKHLQTYILGYTAAAAAFDAVFMTIATAGFGQLAKGFVTAGRMAVGAARAMQAARAAETVAELSRLQRIIRVLNTIPVMNRVIGITRWTVNYAGKVMIAWGRNFRNTLELTAVSTRGAAVKQFLTTSMLNSAKFTMRNMMIMSLASGGMQWSMYQLNPQNSQYKDGGQAFFQGALGGAKFGASSGLLMLMSPIPATALGNGFTGRVMTGVANSPGPIGGSIQAMARAIPKTSGSLVARQGIYGAASEAAFAASPAMRALVNTAVWGGAMIDGALKYYLAAEIPKEIAETGHFAVTQLLSSLGMGPKPEGAGSTSYVDQLASAQHFGMSISQASWLLIPVNTMHAGSDVAQQKEQFYGYSRVMAEGRGSEIMQKPSGEFISYNRSFAHRLGRGEILDMLMGRSKKTGTFQNNEQFKELASRMSSKSRPVAELAALSTVNGEQLSGRQKVGDLMAMMEGKMPATPPATGPPASKAQTASVKPIETPKAPAELPRSARIFSEAMEKTGGKGGTLYAYFSKTGSLQRVSTQGNGKNGVKVEITVTPEGKVELAREGKGLTKVNEAALKQIGGEASIKIGGILAEVNTALAKPAPTINAPVVEAPKPAAEPAKTAQTPSTTANAHVDEVFVTNEGIGAWRKLMERHISGDGAMRKELITNRGESVELKDPKTGKTFTVTGASLKNLREMAEWQELNRSASSAQGRVYRAAESFINEKIIEPMSVFKGPAKAISEVFFAALELTRPSVAKRVPGRLWKNLSGKPLETPAELIVRDLQSDISSEAKSVTGSRKRQISSVGEQVDALAKRQNGNADAQALETLKQVLGAGAKPEQTVRDAKAELAKLSEGVSPALLLKMKRSLMADDPPQKVVERVTTLAEQAGDAGFAKTLREKLAGGDKAAAVKAATEHMGTLKTQGGPLETLAAFERSLDGQTTAADLIHFARKSMDRKIESSAGLEATALRDLRTTIESDAFVQLANKEMASAVFKFQKSGKSPEDLTTLREAVDLVIDTWENGVFGQIFRVRVEKNGEKVWDVPAEFQFRDANGNMIPSFRQGQFEALRRDFLSIAGVIEKADGSVELGASRHMIYNLLQTSGGKTLMSFVLVGFLEAYSKARGKDGAIYATANADLVAQGLEAYKAFFKGRKPNFEILTYSDLMVRQAQADEQGSLGPFDTHDVVMDEFDMVGMGTPLSLGKYQGQLSFAKIDPMQASLKKGVAEAWDVLFAKYGAGQKSVQRHEFMEFRKSNPAFDKEFRDLVARTTKEVRESMQMLDPMFGWSPSSRRYRREFIDSIPDAYAQEKGMSKEQLYLEMVREHRHAFGGMLKLGVIEAKYGSLEKWVEKVIEGGYEAASEGAGLGKLYMRDPQREAIIQFHNDQALDSLDTHYRTALEVREGVPVTLDFENMAVTDFRKINLAAKEANAVTIALSGTLPDGMRPFLKSIGVLTIGKGTDPNKAANIPHEILAPRGELVKQFETGLKAGKTLDLSVTPTGVVEGVGKMKVADRLSVPVETRADGRVALAANMPKQILEKLSPEALERVGLQLDQVNAMRMANKEGTEFQLATAREGIIRLLQDARFKGTRNIAYIWVESLGKMDALLKDLDTNGITMERTSILTSPGSNFFLQERYMFKIKTEKNVEGLKAGEVDVVVLAGQGGLRGLEAPLKAYAGGEIKMFVTDSYSLADVSLLQLLGRIDRGRVPTNSKTTFVLLDDHGTVASSRSFREILPEKIIQAAGGQEAALLAKLEAMMGRKYDSDMVTELFVNPALVKEKDLYRDYLALKNIREAAPAEELAALDKLPADQKKAAAAKIMERPEVMKILVIELRRLAEKDALRSSGIIGH